jgi:hypothetical protein
MNSMEVDPPINTNTPLARIIISKLDTKYTQNNTLDIQMDSFINPPTIAVHDMGILH